ncbi:MAG: hypothetical protein QOI48_3754 [Solirubrobacteraceae bacterium]|jgi:hypothetical protein|nr:hypothetical protein [Solirubrobacteraceae bacterium]
MLDKAEFFTTAAQVLPIAIVGLFVEQRVFDRREHPERSDRVEALGILVLLLTAEWTALFALYEEESTNFGEGVVLLGLVIGFFWLVLTPLRRLLREAAPRLYVWLYLAALVAMGVLVFAFPSVDAAAAVGFAAFIVAMSATPFLWKRERERQARKDDRDDNDDRDNDDDDRDDD